MRMLSGEESPDSGTRVEGHNLVMQYFAQDEATRLDPHPTVHDTLSSGSPMHMVPMIRNILGGFLFSGDDIYKKVRVLSGGERTRLAVARMLLRPSNTLLLDEPTNHLDLDSKEVLLDALVDYGGTLVFVSHDRYFVERLATRVIEVGHGEALVYPGTYREFLWHKEHPSEPAHTTGPTPPVRESGKTGSGRPSLSADRQSADSKPKAAATARPGTSSEPVGREVRKAPSQPDREERKRLEAEARRKSRAAQARKAQVDALETRIADTEAAIRELEARMSAPGFYDDRAAAQKAGDEHQSLMWKVGELMQRWEELQSEVEETATPAE
jgi:ATP-binding cassette subfamily F protein 3